MEKIDRDNDTNDFIDFDDVLDGGYFSDDDMLDLEEDESNYDVSSTSHRSISEL